MSIILDGTNGVTTPAESITGTGVWSVGGSQIYKDASGNVGIGTSSPSTKLHVNGVAYSSTGGLAVGDGSLFTPSGLNSIPNYGVGFTTTGSITGVSGFGGINFYTAQIERARIDQSGNLLVGTTSTGARLFAVASSGIAGKFLTGYASDVSNASLLVSKTDNVSTTSQVFARFSIAADTVASGQINANGASACAFGSWSDERLKTNITPLPSQLNNILALRPVEFDYKNGSGHQTGFIAQEMQAIYPDAIGDDGSEEKMLSITGWDKTTSRLVKAIQELKAIIDTQATRIQALEAK